MTKTMPMNEWFAMKEAEQKAFEASWDGVSGDPNETCPAAMDGNHLWTKLRPTCRHCGADMSW